jgi:tetratricopeptide (TPR) repeat protein
MHEEDHAAHQHDAQGNCSHEAGENGHDDEHEKAMSFMGTPRDPLEAFIRNFRVTQHSHLENGQEKEVLPWLKLAIELNPQAIDTYADTSYWLRNNLKRVEDAREVLREGIRNNPKSFELLFAMGQLYQEADKNPEKARNIWLAAKRFWETQPSETKTNSTIFFGRITGSLARLEEESGNWQQAIKYFEMAKSVSPKPEAIQMQINEILLKNGGSTNVPSSSSPVR